MKKGIKKFIEKIEGLDWNVEANEEENGKIILELSKYSPAGQDFNIQIQGETVDELLDDLYEIYTNFDVSEEAYLWLDDTGHGRNGAPYDMRDLYNDMEACEKMILDLHNELEDN